MVQVLSPSPQPAHWPSIFLLAKSTTKSCWVISLFLISKNKHIYIYIYIHVCFAATTFVSFNLCHFSSDSVRSALRPMATQEFTNCPIDSHPDRQNVRLQFLKFGSVWQPSLFLGVAADKVGMNVLILTQALAVALIGNLAPPLKPLLNPQSPHLHTP